jgi:hypothetical protein
MKTKTPTAKAVAEKAATVKVREHERKMHAKNAFAEGGQVRGIGAARQQKYKEC